MPRRDAVFLSLMKNSCTIVLGSRPAATTGTYGHKTTQVLDTGLLTPMVTYTINKCYFRPYSDQERAITGRADQNIRLYYLYIPSHLVPATLKTQASAASNHQVRGVYRDDGILVDDGPFDIESVQEAAGQDHHWRLSLKRIA